ncbi:P-loop containing nucleoside triphosphate hydrolase protein [Cercophora newfieldiana]|uniref:P-loop containing nucleoside triphosphate hydrolase protein n=1 Tax=Cercophora newfieldiana TaxID=92897 RepID=A0AA40CTQ7_9PEZI|nr:P-loop containing nucleoside triphosphate hydrolase protein [Cercophora newfieldiana]
MAAAKKNSTANGESSEGQLAKLPVTPPSDKTPTAETPSPLITLEPVTPITSEDVEEASLVVKAPETAAEDPFVDAEDASSAASSQVDFEFVDIPEVEYNVQEFQDNDYSSVNEGFVDTQIGSYNPGLSDREWERCVNFFRIKAPPSGAAATRSAARTRVPIDKLPGMSVGLFDYQFMAVLKLISFTQRGLSGGFLADEQGLGKTQEMFGIIAAAHNLRRSKAEVNIARKSNKPNRHVAPGKTANSCPMDPRYGLRCYCYSRPTQDLADRMPEGPTVIIAPARSCAQVLREAKTKLDLKTLKVRLHHETAAKEDKLTPAEIKALTAAISAKTAADGTIEYHYQANAGLSDFIIITSPESLGSLTNGVFGVDVKAGGERKKRDGLMPGIVMLDEFHEYLDPSTENKSKVLAWLQHLKRSCRGPNQPTPLMYFVSGTPFNDSPGDIRPAISLLEREAWAADESHAMAPVTTAHLDTVTATFINLCKAQSEGLELDREDVISYRRSLDRILSLTMVRRLGTSSFRSVPLTSIGPLSVNIIEHAVPAALQEALQSLAATTASLVAAEASARNTTPARFLRSDHAQPLLHKLRLASTFPGIASSSFTFTTEELTTHLRAAGNDPTLTPYHAHIPLWASHSPKLSTLLSTLTTMLADKSPTPGEPSTAKKLIIFTPLSAETLLLHSFLLHRRPALPGLKPVALYPSQSPSERQSTLDKFLTVGNAPPNVLIAPLELAGTGLNLQRAKYSVLMGPAWTKRENQQAYYRVHRVGQRQETKLSLLTARWNPAERAILARYEGKEVDEEKMWDLEGGGEEKGGLVERHQEVGE